MWFWFPQGILSGHHYITWPDHMIWHRDINYPKLKTCWLTFIFGYNRNSLSDLMNEYDFKGGEFGSEKEKWKRMKMEIKMEYCTSNFFFKKTLSCDNICVLKNVCVCVCVGLKIWKKIYINLIRVGNIWIFFF